MEGEDIVDVDHPELNPGDTCQVEGCDGRLHEMSELGTLPAIKGHRQ